MSDREKGGDREKRGKRGVGVDSTREIRIRSHLLSATLLPLGPCAQHPKCAALEGQDDQTHIELVE